MRTPYRQNVLGLFVCLRLAACSASDAVDFSGGAAGAPASIAAGGQPTIGGSGGAATVLIPATPNAPASADAASGNALVTPIDAGSEATSPPLPVGPPDDAASSPVTVTDSAAGTGAAPTGAAPTAASLAVDGPFVVKTFTAGLPRSSDYAAATVYYPGSEAGPFGGVAVAPGFTEAQGQVNWWGPRLASHGFVVLTLDTNAPSDSPAARAKALVSAVSTLRAEAVRQGSPLFAKIDPARMAIMGHSMGGGGTLIAANDNGVGLKAAIPFAPWSSSPTTFPKITVPTLVIAGASDAVAPVATHAYAFYQSIPATTPKAYIEVAGGSHSVANNNSASAGLVGRYGIAWLKLHVDGDERYRQFVSSAQQTADAPKLSRADVKP